VGKTYKDRRKFERKHDKNDGLKEAKREPRKRHAEPLEETVDPYEWYDED
jgi:hypothetical protein